MICDIHKHIYDVEIRRTDRFEFAVAGRLWTSSRIKSDSTEEIIGT